MVILSGLSAQQIIQPGLAEKPASRLIQTLGITTMKSRLAIAFVAASILAVSHASAEKSREDPEWVSLVNLIATPEKYHNKKVFFSAYVIVEFENMSLCLAEHSLSSKDCVWLDIESSQKGPDDDGLRYKATEAIWRQASRQVASIHGTFDKDDTGHFGGWSGAIKNVTRVYAKDVFIDFTANPPVVTKRQSGIKPP